MFPILKAKIGPHALTVYVKTMYTALNVASITPRTNAPSATTAVIGYAMTVQLYALVVALWYAMNAVNHTMATNTVVNAVMR